MTGDVPYYGGRFTPRQAYAAAHPRRRLLRPQLRQHRHGHLVRPVPSDPTRRSDPVAALQHLLDAGVITAEEFERLRSRVPQ